MIHSDKIRVLIIIFIGTYLVHLVKFGRTRSLILTWSQKKSNYCALFRRWCSTGKYHITTTADLRRPLLTFDRIVSWHDLIWLLMRDRHFFRTPARHDHRNNLTNCGRSMSREAFLLCSYFNPNQVQPAATAIHFPNIYKTRTNRINRIYCSSIKTRGRLLILFKRASKANKSGIIHQRYIFTFIVTFPTAACHATT